MCTLDQLEASHISIFEFCMRIDLPSSSWCFVSKNWFISVFWLFLVRYTYGISMRLFGPGLCILWNNKLYMSCVLSPKLPFLIFVSIARQFTIFWKFWRSTIFSQCVLPHNSAPFYLMSHKSNTLSRVWKCDRVHLKGIVRVVSVRDGKSRYTDAKQTCSWTTGPRQHSHLFTLDKMKLTRTRPWFSKQPDLFAVYWKNIDSTGSSAFKKEWDTYY